jgi:hypothetical protein
MREALLAHGTDGEERPRHYWELMAPSFEDSDSTLLRIARHGEQLLQAAYQAAIEHPLLAAPVLELLKKQSAHFQASRRIVSTSKALKVA